jgi:myo-inositol 2-dehydrogenase / D-chiro-inositol 1-dehydrogenase
MNNHTNNHTNNHKVQLGIIGTGRIGQVHAQTLVQRIPLADVRMVTDVNAESARITARKFGIPHVVATFEDMLADDALDAVVICSSTDTHAPFIIKAAQAGKHIFCEKPIAADLTVIDQALNAVDKAGVKLMIGFNRRFDPNHQRIKQAITSGEIGTPHLLHIISRDPAPPPISYVKVSGGMFFDMTIHDFDMARFLFGEVESVYAAAGVMVDPAIGEAGDVDTAVITLKFANGALGTIDNSRKAVYGYDQRVEVFGSAGAARSDNWYPNAVTIGGEKGVRRDLPLNFFMDRYLASYQAELAAFIDCVIHDTPSPVPGTDGRAPVVLALAAMQSVREGRDVRLSEVVTP